jgi:type II secretory pathway component PulM
MSAQAAISAWRNRPARERWLIGLPAVLLVGVVLYIAVWEPLHGSIARLPALETRRAVIHAQAAELRAPSGAAAPAFSAATVQAALDRRQLAGALPPLEGADAGRARLAFAKVPFAQSGRCCRATGGSRHTHRVASTGSMAAMSPQAVLGAGER